MLSGIAGSVLGRFIHRGTDAAATPPTITSDQASLFISDQFREFAARAETDDPSIVDKLGAFYGQHPHLLKSLGGIALAVMTSKLSARHFVIVRAPAELLPTGRR